MSDDLVKRLREQVSALESLLTHEMEISNQRAVACAAAEAKLAKAVEALREIEQFSDSRAVRASCRNCLSTLEP